MFENGTIISEIDGYQKDDVANSAIVRLTGLIANPSHISFVEKIPNLGWICSSQGRRNLQVLVREDETADKGDAIAAAQKKIDSDREELSITHIQIVRFY